MFLLKNVEVDTLEANTLIVGNITTDSIDGVTKEEFSHLKGLTSNLQEQLNSLKATADNLVQMWQ